MEKFEDIKRDLELQLKDEKGGWKWEEILIRLLAIPVAFYVGAHLVMFFFRLIAPS